MTERARGRERGGPGRLDRATELLRQHTDAGWVAVEGSVLRRVRRAVRPSAPVRGRHALGDFSVSAGVLAAEVRARVDAQPDVAATQVSCRTDDADVLQQLTVELVVAYGARITAAADAVHRVVLDVVHELLGPLAGAAVEVATHVHVGDVSDDPRDV